MQDDPPADSRNQRLISLVTLFTPLNFASALVAEPPHLEDQALQSLHKAGKERIESLSNWPQSYAAEPDQFTPLGYKVFDRFFQSFAAFLRSDWNSQEFQHAKDALRASIAAVRTASDTQPLIIAHLALKNYAEDSLAQLHRSNNSEA